MPGNAPPEESVQLICNAWAGDTSRAAICQYRPVTAQSLKRGGSQNRLLLIATGRAMTIATGRAMTRPEEHEHQTRFQHCSWPGQ